MSYFPRRPLIGWALSLVLPGLAADWFPSLGWVWQLLAALLLALALADLALLRRVSTPQAWRETHASVAQGASTRVRLHVRNLSASALAMSLHDHHPPSFTAAGLPADIRLPARAEVLVEYRVTPLQRGEYAFGDLDLVLVSPLGLWSRLSRIALAQPVRVYPDFGEISHYALLARRNRLSAAGVHRRQRRGSGSEFHQLRDYQSGDALRQIDWNASGRFRRLISREYQDERNQQLCFLLDCGQRMRHRDARGSHLDAALNAMLLAAHVAARQGDAVGYMSFAGATDRYLAPGKGAATVTRLLRSSFDLGSSARAADYPRVAEEFMARHMQRALLVLITNTRDGDRDDLLLAARLLQKRHLLIVADLREQRLDQALRDPVTGQREALRFHTAQALLHARRAMHESMRHAGVLTLDILPAQLPLALINLYFELKRSARL